MSGGAEDNIAPLDFDTFCKQMEALRVAVASTIVSQKDPVELLLIASLCGGHTLLVGVPGLAKTLLVKTLARYFRGSSSASNSRRT